MKEESAKKASEILKEKSELFDDLSKITDVPKMINEWLEDDYYILSLNYRCARGFNRLMSCLYINKNEKIKEKVKNLLIIEINNRIKELDEELLNLEC